MLKDVGLKVEGVHFVETYHEGAQGETSPWEFICARCQGCCILIPCLPAAQHHIYCCLLSTRGRWNRRLVRLLKPVCRHKNENKVCSAECQRVASVLCLYLSALPLPCPVNPVPLADLCVLS